MRLIGMVLLAALVAGCYDERSPSDPAPEPSLDAQLRASIGPWGVVPIGPMRAEPQALVNLGAALFSETALSGNRDVACATCHDPLAHGTDALSLPIGTGGVGSGLGRTLGAGRRFVPRNAPSMLNQGLTFLYMFWDGRLNEEGAPGPGPRRGTAGVPIPASVTNLLVAQAMLPVLNRDEMRGRAGDRDVFGAPNELAAFDDSAATAIWSATMRRLLAVQAYVAKFDAAFPGVPASSLGFEHAATAIAAFERQSFTRTNSPFDRYLAHDDRALTDQQKRGGILFFGKLPCASCHSGPMMGGVQFANIGVPQLGPGVGKGAPLDFGRGEEIPENPFYRFAFRVPPLRNVELTAPYMHDGAYPTLEAVVRHYSNADSALRNYDVTQVHPSLRTSYHGDAPTINAIRANIDPRLQRPLNISPSEQQDLVAFLKSLTDPSAR
jgi:cytochrome c peroxidase